MPGDAPSMMRRSAGLLAAACLLVASRAAVAKPPLVQKRFFQATAGATVTVTLRKPNVAGNLLVAYVVWDGGGTASVTDSRGNTYASAVGPTAAAGNPSRAQVFYAANVAAGANVVTATLTSPVARGRWSWPRACRAARRSGA